METHPSACEKTTVKDDSGSVDISRPFRSVKEAVAIFGERFVASDTYSQKPWRSLRQETKQAKDEEFGMVNALKKLEADLEETKRELKSLKEKESETEIALASLNAELHKNMSKMAKAEAAAAAAATRRALVVEGDGGITEEENKTRNPLVRMENSSSLVQILSLAEKEGYFRAKKKERKMLKKKPIIPLVGDLFFSRKKGSSTTTPHSPLYTSSQGYYG